MKKIVPNIAGFVLGAMFIAFALIGLFNLMKMPPPPAGSPAALFFGAVGPTGYMKFVQVLQLLGGLLVLIPRLRNIGLLVLGSIIVNILAYHAFIMNGEGLTNGVCIAVVTLALYLLWCGRKNFSGLLN